MKRILSSLSVVLVVFGVGLSSAPAMAAARAPIPSSSPDASSGLSINPRKNLIVDPGQTVKDYLIVGNLSQTYSLAINIRVIDFTFLNNSGTPKLLLGPSTPQTTWSLKPFLKIPKTEVLSPGATLQIPYSVTMPAHQGAGSYYSAIEYSAAGTGGGNVGLNASGVTLVFVNVPGKVHESLVLQKFGAYTASASTAEAGSYTYINTKKPEEMAFTLKNEGNVTEAPSGSININYMFGGKPIIISNININSDLALIGQSRVFTTCIKPVQQTLTVGGSPTIDNTCGTAHLKPGHYSAIVTAYYGQNGNVTKEVVGTAGFWYLPWWFIIACLVILLIVVTSIWVIVRKIRRRLYGPKKFKGLKH